MQTEYSVCIQANDVILQINEHPIADLEAMEMALKEIQGNQKIKIVVFRGQKEQVIWLDGNIVER